MGTRGANNGVSFLFPPAGLSPNYLDTINITYTSSFPSPLLYTFCVNSANSKSNEQQRVDKVDPYNGTISYLLDYKNVSTCYWNLRPNSTAGNGANGQIITLLSTTRSPEPTTYGLNSEPSSTSSTIPSITSSEISSATQSTQLITSSSTPSTTASAIPTIVGLQSDSSPSITPATSSATLLISPLATPSQITSPPASNTQSSLSTGAGIAIGAAALGVAFIFWFLFHQRRQKSSLKPEIEYEKSQEGDTIRSYSPTSSYPPSIATQPVVEAYSHISEMGMSEPARVELDSRSMVVDSGRLDSRGVVVAELDSGRPKIQPQPQPLEPVETEQWKTRDETQHWKIRRQDFHKFLNR